MAGVGWGDPPGLAQPCLVNEFLWTSSKGLLSIFPDFYRELIANDLEKKKNPLERFWLLPAQKEEVGGWGVGGGELA